MKNLFLILFCFFAITLSGQKPNPLTGLEVNYETSYKNPKAPNGLSTGVARSNYNIDIKLKSGLPSQMAEELINGHSELMGVKNTSALSFMHSHTRTSDIGHVVRHKQFYKNLRVKDSEITINISKANRAKYVLSNLFENIKISDITPQITEKRASEIAKEHLGIQKEPRYEKSELLVYPDENGGRLGYEIILIVEGFLGEWHVMVDANTGELFEALDKAYYYCKHEIKCSHDHPASKHKSDNSNIIIPVNGTGFVFDPDPLSSNMVNYGGGYSDNNDSDSPELNAARIPVILRDIDETNGTYTLNGPWAEIRDHDTPNKGLFQQNSPMFNFNREEDGFEAVTTYFHIDSMMRYINITLGCAVQPYQYTSGVRFDPSGAGGADQSFYQGGTGDLTFGEGCVDDGEDSDVIHHELGHGLHDWLTNGGLSQVNGLSEGFGDYVAQSYNRSLGNWGPADPQYNWIFNWDGHNECWNGRISNSTSLYPNDLVNQVHTDGQIFSTCMMRIWDQIGREKTDKAVFEGISMTNGTSSQNDAAVAIYQAAQTLGCTTAEMTIIFDEMTATGYTLPAPPAPPVASFTPVSSAVNVCPDASGNGEINFFDTSSNLPSSWSWSFTGSANPTTPDNTLQNPIVTVTNSGTIQASLTVTNSEGNDTTSETITVTIYVSCNITCQTFNSGNLGITINPTGAGLEYTNAINVSGLMGQVNDVNITNLNVFHTYSGDLDVTLTSPDNTVVPIVSDNCGTAENIDIGFDDSSSTAIPCPMVGGGIHMPQGSLAGFNTESPNGNWIMKIIDDANDDGGIWNSWDIEVCTLEPVTSTNCVINSIAITNVLCNDSGTNTDPNDDTYTFDVQVNASNGDPSGFNFGGGLSGSAAYGAIINQGPFLISGGDINFTVTDIDDPACNDGAVAITPQTCSESCLTFASTDTPVVIPNSAPPTIITSTISVSTPGVITDLNILNLDIQHTDIRELIVTLEHVETGTSVDILTEICGNDDNIIGSFDDGGSAIICPPNGGVYAPEEPFSIFNGEALAGTWVLTIEDIQFKDGGSLESWSLELCGDFTPSNCPPDFANANKLVGTQSVNADYETDGPIESSQLVNGNAVVDYDSRISVLMDDDFEVIIGTTFHAFIDGCGGAMLQSKELDTTQK